MKQVDQQRNRRRTDPPDDFESLLRRVFIATAEESSQQRQRTPRPLDQGASGGCPDLGGLGQHATGPVEIRTLGLSAYGYRQNAEQRADEQAHERPANPQCPSDWIRRATWALGSWLTWNSFCRGRSRSTINTMIAENTRMSIREGMAVRLSARPAP